MKEDKINILYTKSSKFKFEKTLTIDKSLGELPPLTWIQVQKQHFVFTLVKKMKVNIVRGKEQARYKDTSS